jgi:hypothetical protein
MMPRRSIGLYAHQGAARTGDASFPARRTNASRGPGRSCGPMLALAAFLLLVPTAALAQYTPFGKNKVHYARFDWQVLESRHFRLYHYREEADLARQALDLAEDGYAELRIRFAQDVKHPIPLIVYSSHLDFQQTNVTPYFLPEGVAGLTEFSRGRVLVPFDGSLHDFRVTLRHELVHVFQLSLEERTTREHFRPGIPGLPLWFTEGEAVHFSEQRDSEADMVLRDMVVAGTLPAIGEFWRYEGSFTIYKLGQSVLDYVAESWGEDRLRLFHEQLWRYDKFDDVLHDVLGVTSEELSTRWAYYLKRRYFPAVETAVPSATASKRLTAEGGADFKPLPLPAGLPGLDHHFAFLSPRNGFTNIYTADTGGEKPEQGVRVLVAGERQAEFESFHAFRSRMDVSADGLLLFAAKQEGRDAVNVYSIANRRVVARYAFADLVGLNSPAWAGDTRRIVFSALSREGDSDLYLFDRVEDKLTQLTRDRYLDIDPAWCAWAKGVVWASDRGPAGDRGARNLFLLTPSDGEIRPLTCGDWRDAAPVCDSVRREILFTSDRDGIQNAYRIDAQGAGERLTRSLDALFDPRPTSDGRAFLATVYREGRFEVRSFARADTAGEAVGLIAAGADTLRPWDWTAQTGPVASRTTNYRPRFSLDIAQGGVLMDPGMRTGEGLSAAFSDMMGNHLLFVGLGNGNFSSASRFLDEFSASVAYVNLSRRLNYGLSVFHFAGEYYDPLGFPYFERRAGVGLILRYPFSKFTRVESNASLVYGETDRTFSGFRRSGPLASHSVAWIRDTSLWLPTGPIDGQRVNLTAATTINLRRGGPENTLLLGEWNRYLRLGLLSCYAVRLQGRWSDGENPEVFLLGGSNSLRGWPRRGLNGKRSLLWNNEVRFPLMRGAVLGLPPGDLELPGIQGAVFIDGGAAWTEGWPPPWVGSYGVGLRMGFGGLLVLRLDFARRTDFRDWSRTTRTEFYVGWNY